MEMRGRTSLTAITACIILLFCAESFPSSASEAGRRYSVAQERLADLKKSPKKKRYRSYWMDALRLFDSIEQKYPSSSQAADACFDRADIYLDLHRINRSTKDIDAAAKTFDQCRKAHPRHARAPESLYRIITIHRDIKKDKSAALNAYRAMEAAYADSVWTERARTRLGMERSAKNSRSSADRKHAEIRKPPETVISAVKNPGVVKSVRYWSGGAYTRIVIDQDRPLTFKAFELKKPDRLVFDIQNARIDDSINKEPIPVHDGILRQVRTSQNDPDTVRVVLDLASLNSYVAFPLRDPERLVIDVTGESSEGGEAGAGGNKQAEAATAAQSSAQPSSPSASSTGAGDPKLSLSRQLGLKIRTIAIDAGHGGKDPGAVGKSGLQEKDITLDIARRLAALVKEKLDCKVVLTRDSDEYIPLEDRPAIARTKGADLFVSIHVNASRRRAARGIETYIQSLRASDRDAMATAAFENATSSKTLSQLGGELDRILKDLRTDDKQEESLQLAHYVQNSMVDTMRPVKGHVVNLGVKRAFFYVLINTEMPSILAEVGFISNPEDEKMLRKDSYRQAIAESLFLGVKNYVESRTPKMAEL